MTLALGWTASPLNWEVSEAFIHSVVGVCVSLYQFHTEWERGEIFTPNILLKIFLSPQLFQW